MKSIKFVLLPSIVALAGCSTSISDTPRKPTHSTPIGASELSCRNPASYADRVVGDGHCVSFIKACSGAPNTSEWRPGKKVMSALKTEIAEGTIIATFKNGRYPNQHGWHAAIYISHGPEGIWVWDQWRGKPVHKRLIRVRHDNADAGNTAQAYRIVRTH